MTETEILFIQSGNYEVSKYVVVRECISLFHQQQKKVTIKSCVYVCRSRKNQSFSKPK